MPFLARLDMERQGMEINGKRRKHKAR